MASQYPYRREAFDEEGFLRDITEWNSDMARGIAEHDGLPELTKAQLNLLRHMRFHYLRYGSLPNLKHLCRECHLGRDAYRELFGHSCREAWRIAGLPDPGIEARAYMN
jgi:tRNA 2-thiouridine synthesizing protein E